MSSLRLPSADALADLDDEDIAHLQKPEPATTLFYEPNRWWEKYQYDKYDWDDPAWKRRNRGPGAWKPVLLTQGYFLAVLKVHFKLMTKYPTGIDKKLYAKVQRDKQTGEITGVYAARRGKEGEVSEVQAHREIVGIVEYGLGGEVDHVNGEGLDGRWDEEHPEHNNLIFCGTRDENTQNAVRTRKVHKGLPPGVEKKKNGRYGGIRCVRKKKRGKGSVEVIRSRDKKGEPIDWATPEEAGQWYLDELAKLHNKRKVWAHTPRSVSYIDLPPLKKKRRAPHSVITDQDGDRPPF